MIPIPSLRYDKEQICRYLVRYQHLCDDSALQDGEDIVSYVRKVGCIQYDPLDVVGRNPDLVLQARCRSYRKGDIEALLYGDRVLFDVWDKNMSISTVADWSCFERFRRRFLDWCREHQTVVDEITEYLQWHDSACSSDFAHDEKVSWHYGPQRLAKAALEAMCYAGLAVVHHKKGTRRYYALAETHIPEQYFTMAPPYRTEAEYFKWGVLRRINAVGLLWNRPSDAWLGINGLKSGERNQAFHTLLDEGAIAEISVDGIKQPLYIAAENLDMLQAAAAQAPDTTGCARILAPLDNLLWDRKLIADLFGFEYKWEVYTPVPQRKYGYYVLPVLCGHQLAARLELATDLKSKTLLVNRIWLEDGMNSTDVADRILAGIDVFREYNRCTAAEMRCTWP
ncbi:DNA glycosylase AlkZ-like family protein [Paenibacillus sp. YN15]|uniref:DNA glycosylase AlkZ-like family protein n=1 Tax=Paenibacillus sp. YN15 TaxID=1742774 RepID=UPI000DCBEB15|nr:crosslink repair DNA glycosylase YcaQ family protein [Paenibacillus sp. YN15]RAV01284.1 hypothetical protein DQG13_12985 [Paenibacillus sp. YN15]